MMRRLVRTLRAKVSPTPVQQPVGGDFVPWLDLGLCPDCGGREWYEGPSGGSCTNFTCAGCKQRFNVAMPPLNLIQRI